MKILFLDFDGVLNGVTFVRCGERAGAVLDKTKLMLLKQIVDATGAKIVLTTSWREHWWNNLAECDGTGEAISLMFRTYGLEILDKTPKLHTAREKEIKSWLDAHPETENFVVLDDSLLGADFLGGHFVKTSGYFGGLDETDAQKAIRILNG